MIKQWCYILCVAPLKTIMNCMNLINLMRQTNKMMNFEDYGGILSIPFSCFSFLSLQLQLRQSLFLLIYLFFLTSFMYISEVFLRILCRFCVEVTGFSITVEQIVLVFCLCEKSVIVQGNHGES